MTSVGESARRHRGIRIPIFGIIVTTVGIILLLNTFDVLRWSVWLDVWRLWPALLILAGLKFLFPPFHPLLTIVISVALVGGAIGFAFAASEGDLFTADFTEFSYELDRAGSNSLNLDVSFGAGIFRVEPLPASDRRLLAVEFFDDESDVKIIAGDRGPDREVSIKQKSDGFSFFSRSGDDREWTVRINPSVLTELNIDGGAGKFVLDLTETRVVHFDADIGAADLDVFAPHAAGHVDGAINAGASDISVTIPPTVAARIDNDSGVSTVEIDSTRFPKSSGVHESAGFPSAMNRIDLKIQAGVSNIVVK